MWNDPTESAKMRHVAMRFITTAAAFAAAAVITTAMPIIVAAAETRSAVCVENATIDDLQTALAAGRISSADLVRAYTARIEAYDRAGPALNSVREINPD